MKENKMLIYIKDVLGNMPADWLNLTTHRLDIYNEQLAKTEFLEQFETLFNTNNSQLSALHQLPTAYDYVRLGHPLSCVLEWAVAKLNHIKPEQVIGFSSKTMPILAILRNNLLANKNTQILYNGELPKCFDAEVIKQVYGYKFTLRKIENLSAISSPENFQHANSTILISQQDNITYFNLNPNIDFFINTHQHFGSILVVNGKQNNHYIPNIQHVRRRETIAMTPANCLSALKRLTHPSSQNKLAHYKTNKAIVLDAIATISGSKTKALVASSGLSIQYAIMMGLIDNALEKHKGKTIKFIVPPNCYGGTNDQARRVATCNKLVEIVDLPVDGDNNMVESLDTVLNQIAIEDAVPFIIAEIPTNPRVEVPNLKQLKAVLSAKRKTSKGTLAINPVFILDQTFCPNVQFLGEGKIFSTLKTISYASGSKFASGGLCTAGYCVGNKKTEIIMDKIELHLKLCDNEATDTQMKILAKQLPTMNQRIIDAYKNTREFVNFIGKNLPNAKINFVSQELAKQGFTPSVFSLDLPTKGDTAEEKEAHKRALNHKLIRLMISKIPNQSKHCVSYGQLKGCYWTIPATSTQGTTKEGDKDYIARVALSPDMDLERHKKVFLDFVDSI
ncbi:cystathionine beta-synthase [Gelatiniphilus marinus]|uniref:Cystathionine beta-synthase n=1 Tax=Gelatiniphilus marinus TaxID=1759464 RepID=A0ABW5JQQ1_9FLAO